MVHGPCAFTLIRHPRTSWSMDPVLPPLSGTIAPHGPWTLCFTPYQAPPHLMVHGPYAPPLIRHPRSSWSTDPVFCPLIRHHRTSWSMDPVLPPSSGTTAPHGPWTLCSPPHQAPPLLMVHEPCVFPPHQAPPILMVHGPCARRGGHVGAAGGHGAHGLSSVGHGAAICFPHLGGCALRRVDGGAGGGGGGQGGRASWQRTRSIISITRL